MYKDVGLTDKKGRGRGKNRDVVEIRKGVRVNAGSFDRREKKLISREWKRD